jgi:hypothetical protein
MYVDWERRVHDLFVLIHTDFRTHCYVDAISLMQWILKVMTLCS